MIKTYMPNALMKAAALVAKKHPLSESNSTLTDSELSALLERIVSCREDMLEGLAASLLPREITGLCCYLPHNRYNKTVANIVTAVSYNMNSKYWGILFRQWHHYPYNRLVLRLLSEHEEANKGHTSVPHKVIVQWARSSDCFAEINNYVDQISGENQNYASRFEKAGLHANTPLQKACMSYYLTKCSLNGFIAVGDEDAASCAKQSKTEITELILLNLLISGAMERRTLSQFSKSFSLMQNIWKQPDSGFFPKNQRLAYEVYSWLYKYVEMSASFSNDADIRRKNFWEQYLDSCEIERMKKHQMVIFYFRNHCVVEFEVIGRIYVFDKSYFKDVVLTKVMALSTSQVKSWMFSFAAYEYEKAHQGKWEIPVAHYLRKII